MRRSSTVIRRVIASVALAGSIAVAMIAGPAQDGWSAGGGDGNWPAYKASFHRGR